MKTSLKVLKELILCDQQYMIPCEKTFFIILDLEGLTCERTLSIILDPEESNTTNLISYGEQ